MIAISMSVVFDKCAPDEERKKVRQMHADALMLLADLLHSNKIARKAFVTPAYDKKN